MLQKAIYLITAVLYLSPISGLAQRSPQDFFRPQVTIESVDDLREYVHGHVARCGLLARIAFEDHREFFPALSADDALLVRQFLRLHDQSKLNTSPDFVAKYYPREDRFAELLPDRLLRIFGGAKAQVPSETVAEVVADLNAIDRAVAHDFFKRMKLLDKDGNPNAKARELLRLEKIADAVDRGMASGAPVEFGRAMIRASYWLSNVKDREVAALLELSYSSLHCEELLSRDNRFAPAS